MSARLRASLRLRLAFLGAVGLLLISAGGLIAVTTSSPGPFTGCLSSKLGVIYNVAQGVTPKAACFRDDSMVTFSNAQGPVGPTGAEGAKGDTGPAGPGSKLWVGGPAVDFSVPPNSGPTVFAPCPADTQVVGGGWNVSGGIAYQPGVTVNGSWPGIPSNGNGWTVWFTNNTTHDVAVTVFPKCARLYQ
jgi:hypothetical protein